MVAIQDSEGGRSGDGRGAGNRGITIAFREFILKQSPELSQPIFDGIWGTKSMAPGAIARAESADWHYVLMRCQKIPASQRKRLTSREYDVALLVAIGLPNKSIARELGIVEYTVAEHLRRVFDKLSIDSRVALAIMVFLWGDDLRKD